MYLDHHSQCHITIFHLHITLISQPHITIPYSLTSNLPIVPHFTPPTVPCRISTYLLSPTSSLQVVECDTSEGEVPPLPLMYETLLKPSNFHLPWISDQIYFNIHVQQHHSYKTSVVTEAQPQRV